MTTRSLPPGFKPAAKVQCSCEASRLLNTCIRLVFKLNYLKKLLH